MPPPKVNQPVHERPKCNNHPYKRSILPGRGPYNSRLPAQSQTPTQAQIQTKSNLLTLPQEVLTIILSHALTAARLCPSCKILHPLCHMLWEHPYSIFGLSSFPLLFVNWQTHRELLRLIYANIFMGMTGYHLHSSSEAAGMETSSEMANWVQSRTLTEHVRKLTLCFSPSRGGGRYGKWEGKDGRWAPLNTVSTSPEIMLELVGYLKTFKVLREVEVRLEITRNGMGGGNEEIVGEKELDPLLPLFGIQGVRCRVCVRTKMIGLPTISNQWSGRVVERAGRVSLVVEEWARLREVGFDV